MEKISLKDYTTFNIGGEACLSSCYSKEEVQELWKELQTKGIKSQVIGGGSNMIASDSGFDGRIVKLDLNDFVVSDFKDHFIVSAGAGIDWDDFIPKICDIHLTGVEQLVGIPGSVGASPVQNIGAYGAEVSEFIYSVECFDSEAGEFVTFNKDDCEFTYRGSIFNSKAKGRYWITSVDYRFEKLETLEVGHREIVAELGSSTVTSAHVLKDAIMDIRTAKGMLAGDQFPKSAGSFFKNPVISKEHFERVSSGYEKTPPHYAAGEDQVKVPAAWLIGEAGFPKGLTHKGVGISPYHNLSLINLGDGTCTELLELAGMIQDGVKAKFDIELKIEPEIIGKV